MTVHYDAGRVLALITDKLGQHILESRLNLGDAELRISRNSVRDVFPVLRDDPDLRFEMLVSETVVDYLDSGFMPRAEAERFDVVYHLLSLTHRHRLRIKVAVPEQAPEVASLTDLWPSANFMEREAWDMFGVVFNGHPDLRRVLMYEEFKGHPLRKDYPLQGKQPRIPLRHLEVRNTARDMHRPELVSIRKRDAQPQAATAKEPA